MTSGSVENTTIMPGVHIGHGPIVSTGLGPLQGGYLDYFGSGSETIAHLRENGRITVMFSAFEGQPNIVRLYGRGRFIRPGEAEFDELRGRFSKDRTAGQRSIVLIDLDRVQESCGYSVPKMALVEQRDLLDLYQEMRPTSTMASRRTQSPSTACPPGRSLDAVRGQGFREGELHLPDRNPG